MSGSRTHGETRTQIGIVGAGPVGLLLSHLLARAGIESVVLDVRSRGQIEGTHRAGILEHDSVRLLTESGVSDRVLRDGSAHEGITLAFGGAGHRIDFANLVDASVWLYPQTDVFIDLAAARERDGGDVRYGVAEVSVRDVTSEQPRVRFTDEGGRPQVLRCDYLVGADGAHSSCRASFPEERGRQYTKEYPFAWFGILAEAPPSAPELIYNHSERGFALISQRTRALQRMYFQCDPAEDPEAWSEEAIWAELAARVGANGFTLCEGPIVAKSVLGFRSFVQEPMRHGRLLLAGDAAHTVPPTGAKGLNLALADVTVLAEVLQQVIERSEPALLDGYTERALARVWKAQYFSYWMTRMCHRLPGDDAFDIRRQVGELETLTSSMAGRTYLAECYTGWPQNSG
jgi:p-hydroxybenzoate 3-monooxygenase